MSYSLRPHEPQHARPPCPSPTPRVYPNPCPSSRWCHPTISSSVVPFSSCPQSFPASGSFPMSHKITPKKKNPNELSGQHYISAFIQSSPIHYEAPHSWSMGCAQPLSSQEHIQERCGGSVHSRETWQIPSQPGDLGQHSQFEVTLIGYTIETIWWEVCFTPVTSPLPKSIIPVQLWEKTRQISIKGAFPGGPVVKNPPANAGDTGLIPDPGRLHMPQSS